MEAVAVVYDVYDEEVECCFLLLEAAIVLSEGDGDQLSKSKKCDFDYLKN